MCGIGLVYISGNYLYEKINNYKYLKLRKNIDNNICLNGYLMTFKLAKIKNCGNKIVYYNSPCI